MWRVKLFWKRTFDYKGVISRKEFFLTIGANILTFLMINFIALLFALGDAGREGVLLFIGRMIAYAGVIYLVVQILPTISLIIRRLHDHNDKWWYVFLAVNPIGLVALIVFLCMGTVKENNRWREEDIKRGYLMS